MCYIWCTLQRYEGTCLYQAGVLGHCEHKKKACKWTQLNSSCCTPLEIKHTKAENSKDVNVI